jgi:hypothetical protein
MLVVVFQIHFSSFADQSQSSFRAAIKNYLMLLKRGSAILFHAS